MAAWILAALALPMRATAQTTPSLQLVRERELIPASAEPLRDWGGSAWRRPIDYFTPDFIDEGRRSELLHAYAFALGLASGYLDQTRGPVGAALEPGASLTLSGHATEGFAYQLSSALSVPLVLTRGGSAPGYEPGLPEGSHDLEAVLSMGEELGLTLHIAASAEHGQRPSTTGQHVDLGDAPFVDGNVEITARPWIMVERDMGLGLSTRYELRTTHYDATEAPLESVVRHGFGAGFTMCFPDILGTLPCIDIMRVRFAHTALGASPDAPPGPVAAAMPLVRSYEELNMQVGFIDGMRFGDIRVFAYISPAWIWDADVCTFEDDLRCTGDHRFRRAGWTMAGAAGYSQAIDEWAWALAFVNSTGHSPDGHLLGSKPRFELGLGYQQDAATPWGAKLDLVVGHFGELICTSCLAKGEELPFDEADLEDNAMTRVNVSSEVFATLLEPLRVGLRYNAFWGSQIGADSWRIEDDRTGSRHELLAFMRWQPDLTPPDEPEPARLRLCGDGRIEGDEVCDDGNALPNDGCYDCRWEAARCEAQRAVAFSCAAGAPTRCVPVDCQATPQHAACPRVQVAARSYQWGLVTVGARLGQVEPQGATPACSCNGPTLGPGGTSAAGTRAGTACQTECAFTLPACAPVELVAVPGDGQTFDRWDGACVGQGERCVVTPQTDLAVAAHFQSTVASTPTVELLVDQLPAGSTYLASAWAADGAYAIALDMPGPALRRDAAQGTIALTSGAGRWVLRFGPEGAFAWAREVRGDSSVHGLAFGPGGELLVVGAYRGSLQLGDAPSGAEDGGAGGLSDLFVGVFDARGALLWAQGLRDVDAAVRHTQVAVTDAPTGAWSVVVATTWDEAGQTRHDLRHFDPAGNLTQLQTIAAPDAEVRGLVVLGTAADGQASVLLTQGGHADHRSLLARGAFVDAELATTPLEGPLDGRSLALFPNDALLVMGASQARVISTAGETLHVWSLSPGAATAAARTAQGQGLLAWGSEESFAGGAARALTIARFDPASGIMVTTSYEESSAASPNSGAPIAVHAMGVLPRGQVAVAGMVEGPLELFGRRLEASSAVFVVRW